MDVYVGPHGGLPFFWTENVPVWCNAHCLHTVSLWYSRELKYEQHFKACTYTNMRKITVRSCLPVWLHVERTNITQFSVQTKNKHGWLSTKLKYWVGKLLYSTQSRPLIDTDLHEKVQYVTNWQPSSCDILSREMVELHYKMLSSRVLHLGKDCNRSQQSVGSSPGRDTYVLKQDT